jgi:type IV pilus assembly protein PilV
VHLREPLTKRSSGFSLIEVLVTFVIVAVGLLGLAKTQAASIANTQISRARSLIALQAESLASSMRGNRGYWASGPTAPAFTATGTTVVDTSGVLTGTTDCSTITCTPAQLAAHDVQSWIQGLNSHFPSYSATVTCNAGVPLTCSIAVTWSEKYIAINRSTAASSPLQASTQSFTLLVEP